MSDRKKLLVLIDWYVPAYKAGGPIQSVRHVVEAMRDHYEIFVVAGDTDLGDDKPYISPSNQWIQGEHPNVQLYFFSKAQLTYSNLTQLIDTLSPDVIYLNHLFSPYFVLAPLWHWWRKRSNARMVVCPRGALFGSAMHHGRSYWKKWITVTILRWASIYRRVHFHATDEREGKAVIDYFPSANVSVVNNNGSSIQHPFTPCKKEPGELNLIYIARVLPIKNLLYALESLRDSKGRISFTIIGPMEDRGYWSACEEVIKSLPSNISVNYLGPLPPTELRNHLINHHLFFLPTTGENFGHSIFEALQAGRPVLISDQTPWRELTSKHCGWDLPLSEEALFKKAIDQAVTWEQAEFDGWCKSAWQLAAQYSSHDEEIKKYRDLFG